MRKYGTPLTGTDSDGKIGFLFKPGCDDNDPTTIDFLYNGVCQHKSMSCENGFADGYIGDISCVNTTMTNFDNWTIKKVAGDLKIFNNEDLNSSGLSSLQEVTGDFTFVGALRDDSSTNTLTDLNISNLTTVGGNFDISSKQCSTYCYGYKQLSNADMSSLTTVGGDLKINYNNLPTLNLDI